MLSRYSLTRPRSLRAEDALQVVGVLGDRIENAALLPRADAPLLDAVPAWPNSRSNTTRGLISIGSGVVGELHEIVFM